MKTDKEKLLEKFMKEFFPFKEFTEIGFFTKEMKGNYQSQANKVCKFFGLTYVYEYGRDEIRCHISYGDGVLDSRTPMHLDKDGELKSDFITVTPSIYENRTD